MKEEQRDCYLREFLCEDKKCRAYVDWMEMGNCILRCDREHTLEEIGIAFGITRERARQIAEKAMKKFWYKYPMENKGKYKRHPPADLIVRHKK